MFVFVSVPMMEKRALATREGYREYRERTPMLLPETAAAGGSGGRGEVAGAVAGVPRRAAGGPALLAVPVLAHLDRGRAVATC